MSQTNSLILTGSRAAEITGNLPLWRRGQMDDYDFYGSQADMEILKEWICRECQNPEWVADKEGNTHYVDRRGLSISVMKHSPLSELFLKAPDTTEGKILGLDTLVIGPYTQLAIKLGYLNRSDFHNDKNRNDVQYWLNTLSKEKWCSVHHEILICMRERSFNLFGKEYTPYEGSEEELLISGFIGGRI